MQELQSKHIVLGLTGGVACYKVAQLCRLLTKVGATVQVVMTEAAQQFITPVTMQALSGRPVFTSQWDARPENNMAHINLGRARIPLRAIHRAVTQRLQGNWRDELGRRFRHHHLHRRALFDQRPAQLGRFVAGNAARKA